MAGLWELAGRGGKPKWKEEDIEFLTECLKNEPRTYNAGSISSEIRKRAFYQIKSRPIKTNTKKKGLYGNEPEKVIKENKKLQYAKSNKQT